MEQLRRPDSVVENNTVNNSIGYFNGGLYYRWDEGARCYVAWVMGSPERYGTDPDSVVKAIERAMNSE